jgi:hypothetical protein
MASDKGGGAWEGYDKVDDKDDPTGVRIVTDVDVDAEAVIVLMAAIAAAVAASPPLKSLRLSTRLGVTRNEDDFEDIAADEEDESLPSASVTLDVPQELSAPP